VAVCIVPCSIFQFSGEGGRASSSTVSIYIGTSSESNQNTISLVYSLLNNSLQEHHSRRPKKD